MIFPVADESSTREFFRGVKPETSCLALQTALSFYLHGISIYPFPNVGKNTIITFYKDPMGPMGTSAMSIPPILQSLMLWLYGHKMQKTNRSKADRDL